MVASPRPSPRGEGAEPAMAKGLIDFKILLIGQQLLKFFSEKSEWM